MHACGHDGHVAIGLGTARLLAKYRSNLHGSVKFVFQPAEEAMNGAEAMIGESVLESPVPDRCLSVHVWSSRPVGWISFTPGPTMAGADFFKVRISGKGAHGATPHLGIDPVHCAAHIVTASKSLVNDHISPMQAAVLTVTSFQAGEAYNVIPPYADLKGTMRTFTPQSRQVLLDAFESLLKNTAAAFGCQVEWEFLSRVPAVTNDLETTHMVEIAARSILPDLDVDTRYQTMVSDDMALMLEKIPGCYYIVGAANESKGFNYPHHHPKFDIDEEALPIATAVMAASAASFLADPQTNF
jgi:amidohydrolase